MDILRPVLDQIAKLWARLDLMPVVRWGTVTQASPLRVILDGDTDAVPFTPQSLLKGIPVGSRVLCVEQHRRLIVLGATDGGWVTLSTGFASGFTSADAPMQYRIKNGVCYWRGGVSGTLPSGAYTRVINVFPAEARPSQFLRVGGASSGAEPAFFEISPTGYMNVAHNAGTAREWAGFTTSYPLG